MDEQDLKIKAALQEKIELPATYTKYGSKNITKWQKI